MSAAFVLDLSAIPDAQRAAVQALLEEVAALKDITRRQEHLIAELNHALHGKRSEKLTEDERQLAFEDLSIALAEVEASRETQATRAGKGATRPAPKRNIGNLPAALPRIEEVIEPASLICPCGCGIMHKIGEDRSERLDIVPAQLRVIVTVRPKYACRSCTDGVTQAPAPSRLITGGLPTEATLAHVLVSKYADHLPLYRQSQILARAGLDLHRAVLADWVAKTPWVDFLAEDPATRSNTSVCLKVVDPTIAKLSDDAQADFAKKLASLLEKEGAAMLVRTGTTTVADVEAMPELLPDIWRNTPLRVISFQELAERLAGGNVAKFLNEQTVKGLGTFVVSLISILLCVGLARFLYKRQIFIRL